VEQIAEVHNIIRAVGAEFDWSGTFMLAAGKGNTAVMRYLHDEMLFDQRTLNQALSAVVATGDMRDAAHHLALWGANPAAPYEINGVMAAPTIFDAVIKQRRFGIAEELAQWRFEGITPEQMERFTHCANLHLTKDATNIHWSRREARKMRGGKLSIAFRKALDDTDVAGVMADYAEARRDRFLRGNVTLTKSDGGGALALALRHDKFEFARLLVAEGYSLADASAPLREDLRRHGSDAAQQFAADQLSGKLQVPNVPDVGRRRRSEIQILSMPRPGHYGMF